MSMTSTKMPFRPMVVLTGHEGSHKTEQAMELIHKVHCRHSVQADICCVSGFDVCGHHVQLSPQKLRKLILEDRGEDTIFLLTHFWFGLDREAYLHVIEDACSRGIRIYKTDIRTEDITENTTWIDRYCFVIDQQDM